MRLGFDFDNTLINYDTLFHRVALEKGLIAKALPKQKNAVRDYLREQNREDEWTRMQGEVYGQRILEAEPYQGMRTVLDLLSREQIPMCIVSHKTRTPYLGEPWDLHEAARRWLAQQGFYEPTGLNWPEDQVFFELTKDDKVARIVDLGCTHYVDDLPEILEMLPDSVGKILFSPSEQQKVTGNWLVMRTWQELPKVLKVH